MNLVELPGPEGQAPSLDLPPVLDVQDPGLVEHLRDLGISWAFSAVPSDVALALEPRLVDGGFRFSNASAYRRRTDIPLVVADVNPHHLQTRPEGSVLHACATNCTLIPLLMPYPPSAGPSGCAPMRPPASKHAPVPATDCCVARSRFPSTFLVKRRRRWGILIADLHEGKTLPPLTDRCVASAWMRPTSASSTW